STCFCSHASAPTEPSPLSLHDALPICVQALPPDAGEFLDGLPALAEDALELLHRAVNVAAKELEHADDDVFDDVELSADDRGDEDRKSTRLNSSHVKISYAVFCLKKKR